MKRFLKVFAFSIACLLTLIFLAYQFENLRGWLAWKNYKAKVERSGESLDASALIPPPVPDGSNFAAIPYFTDLFKTNQSADIKTPLTEFTSMLQKTEKAAATSNSFVSYGVDMVKLLASMQGSNQAAASSQEMASLEGQATSAAATNPAPESTSRLSQAEAAERVLSALESYDPIVNQIEQAADRPFSRYPVEYAKQPPFAILLPHLSAVRSASLFFKTRAMAELESGKADQAFKDVQLMFKLADSLHNEPVLISFLVRIAILNHSFEPVAVGLSSGLWSDSQLADLQKEYLKLHFFSDLDRAMQAERIFFGLVTLNYLRQMPNNAGLEDIPPALLRTLPDGWYYLEMRNYHRLSSSISKTYNVDQKMAFPKEVKSLDEELEKELRANFIKSIVWDHTFFSRLLLPALSSTVIRAAKMQTGVELAAVACALERYRLAHGRYPERLEQIDSLLPRPIRDVITGQSLQYKLEPEGYAAYSVGWNENDDGGYVQNKKKGQREAAAEGDWTWRPLPSNKPVAGQ